MYICICISDFKYTYVKIYHKSGTYNWNSQTQHLVWQIGQGLSTILPQCSFKNSFDDDFSLVIDEKFTKLQN